MYNKKQKLESFIGQDLVKFAKEHNYSKECIMLLKNEDVESEQDANYKFLADKRTIANYKTDVIYGWLIENYLKDKFNSIDDVYASLSGTDKKRKFLDPNKITRELDLIVEIEDNDLYNIEIVMDFGEFWKNKGVCHFRSKKLLNLIEKSKTENVFVLAVDVVNKEMGFININSKMEYKYIKSHSCFGGKPAYEIKMDTSKFFNIDDIKQNTYKYLKRAS